jgi:lauroyl/myristoyl acyltransferase
MIVDTAAATRLPQILERGGTVAILADHHAARRGVPVTFLGLETAASRSVGLLAARYEAVVAVAGIRRTGDAFHFEIVVADLFDQSAWRDEDDPVVYITGRFVSALERIVLADPTQYLWAHARWGADLARRMTGEAYPARVDD